MSAATPVEAGKTTMARMQDDQHSLRVDVDDHEQRLQMLERADRMFKAIAVSLLVLVFGAIVWCGTEFHAVAEILVKR